MPAALRFWDGGKYSGLTKIRTRRPAAGSTNGTEPVRPVLGRLRESFPLSRGGATTYRFLLIRYNFKVCALAALIRKKTARR
ncbi:hypothetical protein E5O75_02425 [Neisseria gonorrhoeae]|nr:hypothetical protein EGH17_12845 [Neisseria gonorrhoeae]ROU24368.1 hypothetical protein EGO84_05605 [Neisseria gonorrhoeae]ROU25765.1 hypothetical protein EGP18_04090 [Neisseria gonorrhoeae]ROU28203.1 hypothetical protein EGO69_03895 [Neisseria gonorrhoeae]ROU31006.1 hypothetical protein EGO62_03665 [Neisseria gonorrhoeae]